MDNKKLLYILIALLGVYGLNKLFSGKKERSFKTELIVVDTAQVTAITVFPKADEFAEVSMKKENDEWIISKGDFSTKAVTSSINSLLEQLALIKTQRIAAKSEEKWADYEVEEGKGTRMVVYTGSKVVSDFIIGKFDFKQSPQAQQQFQQQQQPTITSYVRLNGEPETYAVDGFLSMSLGQGFDAYRNKELIAITKEDINQLDFSEGNSSYSINKSPIGWAVNGTEVLDSTKVDSYLTALSNISGTEFVNDFDAVQHSDKLAKSLTIKANNMVEPVSIHCYADSTRAKPFIIHSTLNKDGYFASDSAGIYSRIFISPNELVGGE